MKRILVYLSLLLSCGVLSAQPLLRSQWEGARVAFLGDSITDARQIGSTNNIYWNNLIDILGIQPYVYGISGHRMNQIVGQGERLEREHGQEVDA
ncbi:MAG: SGNH/GDSL hydrolase family protein, partial [Bacteroidales bacterium]|nr:SGNH/GDSL hydrolase family protein [Bacteroidales bacterium]